MWLERDARAFSVKQRVHYAAKRINIDLRGAVGGVSGAIQKIESHRSAESVARTFSEYVSCRKTSGAMNRYDPVSPVILYVPV